MKRYSLYLINPKRKYRYPWDLKEISRIMGRKTAVHPLALPTIAALTPDHYDVRIIDEEIEPLPNNHLPDLVGITAMIPNISRAYEIADHYRALGVPVVMGGPQVSYNVEETLRHADSVVIGEAEDTWQLCLEDFERGSLKPTYHSEKRPAFQEGAIPRWDLVDTAKVMALGVQASRGCPYACDFCLVPNLFGKRQRYRRLENVVAEIKSLPKKQITFVDDNLTADKAYARTLMEELKPLGVSWACQASFDLIDHPDLIRHMAAAGCHSILFGIESVNPASIEEAHKRQNKIARYEEGIRLVHSMGIHVIASFIVGFDSDTLQAFDDIYNFCARNHISLIQLNILIAYPGTNLYERLKPMQRLNPIDPDLLNGIYPTLQFNNMSQTELYHRYFETLGRIFSFDHVRKKITTILSSGVFKRENTGDITVRDKFTSVAHLLSMYLFTLDRSRRQLLLDLFKLVRNDVTTMNVIVEFLLFISSFHGYLKYTRKHGPAILETIQQYDRGPWRHQFAATAGQSDSCECEALNKASSNLDGN